MTGDSELGLWDNECTVRGMVRAVCDGLNQAITVIQVGELATRVRESASPDPDALDHAIASQIVARLSPTSTFPLYPVYTIITGILPLYSRWGSTLYQVFENCE